jgi:homopolymeric O-antigen transport system permease protein
VQNITRIYALSKRNVILRYKSSLIGFFWGFVKPLLYLLIFIVIFSAAFLKSQYFPSLDNYIIFTSAGLIFWFFFSNVTNQAIGSIVGSSGLIKSLNVPILFFPLSEILSELFNFSLTLLVFLVVMYWFGIQYNLQMLLIIPCTLIFSVFCLGIILLLSSLNVFFRDVGIMWGTIQPALFYMTPIMYPEALIPEKYKLIIKCNPVYYFIKLGRSIFYDAGGPPSALWIHCTIIAVLMYIIGAFVFNKLKNQFISTI